MLSTNLPCGVTKGILNPPEFTYTGQCELITEEGKGWKIRFLTSGVFQMLSPSKTDADIFLVGGGGGGGIHGNNGGGGGGGGGYTRTARKITISAGTTYSIEIGSFGWGAYRAGQGSDGGATTAFGQTAGGGKLGGYGTSTTGKGETGGAGGSGGGAGAEPGHTAIGYDGGTDGSDGESSATGSMGGAGQHMTTREFGEADGAIYSGGGGGGANSYGVGVGKGGIGGGDGGPGNAAAGNGTFFGGGGGGGADTPSTDYSIGGNGYQGIVIIRNHREVTS